MRMLEMFETVQMCIERDFLGPNSTKKIMIKTCFKSVEITVGAMKRADCKTTVNIKEQKHMEVIKFDNLLIYGTACQMEQCNDNIKWFLECLATKEAVNGAAFYVTYALKLYSTEERCIAMKPEWVHNFFPNEAAAVCYGFMSNCKKSVMS